MLTDLRIENFAIIPHLDLTFNPGLVVFTGETGAGKSIILDAIEMVLGGKTDTTTIRSGSERASAEAIFKIMPDVKETIHAILAREDLLDDPDYVVLAREVRREGRSTARVNGRSVNASLLRDLGAYLVDIHGQSEHLSLLDPRQHLGLLDRYAESETLLSGYRKPYQELQVVRRELKIIRQTEKEASRKTDLLTYQAEEIEAAQLQPGEEETLRQDRTRLANAENLASLAQEALALLDDGTPEAPAITDLLGQVQHAMSGLSRVDPSRAALQQQAETALDLLSDLSHDLRNYLEEVEFNPKRLEQIEERLDLLNGMKRKYGGSIEAVLTYAGDARKQLELVAHATERIADLEGREQILLKKLSQQGQSLTAKRRQAAEALGRGIESELADLRMVGARFGVYFQTRPDPEGVLLSGGDRVAFDASGLDRVEFMVAPNPGEGLKPLAKTASGGETSRLMLALKNVLAQADTIPTLVFDEIDQGIGGRVGRVVGEKLRNLARRHQVLCITHLPQLAAYGAQHLRVAKKVEGGRTVTQVEMLEGDDRRQELAQMLGGISEGTLRSADEILQAAQKYSA